IDEYRDHLIATGAKLVREERGADVILDRAWRMYRMRRLVVKQESGFVVLPKQRPLLEYYANSIVHLLPGQPSRRQMHPAHDDDRDLPALRPRNGLERGEKQGKPS
ncbi:MAG: hypothetical protein JSW51_03390, partial [Gemmatimonadota bacterium]